MATPPIDPSQMNIPPELLALLEEATQGGLAQDQLDPLAAQYKAAQHLRDTPMPEMRRYGDNHVVAPNAMEVAAAAIKQYRGNQQMNDVTGQRPEGVDVYSNLAKSQQGWKAGILQRLLREYGNRGAAPTPQAPFQSPQGGFSALDNPFQQPQGPLPGLGG
jgi:hypothetical protein